MAFRNVESNQHHGRAGEDRPTDDEATAILLELDAGRRDCDLGGHEAGVDVEDREVLVLAGEGDRAGRVFDGGVVFFFPAGFGELFAQVADDGFGFAGADGDLQPGFCLLDVFRLGRRRSCKLNREIGRRCVSPSERVAPSQHPGFRRWRQVMRRSVIEADPLRSRRHGIPRRSRGNERRNLENLGRRRAEFWVGIDGKENDFARGFQIASTWDCRADARGGKLM